MLILIDEEFSRLENTYLITIHYYCCTWNGGLATALPQRQCRRIQHQRIQTGTELGIRQFTPRTIDPNTYATN
jgi:hypothetical protein